MKATQKIKPQRRTITIKVRVNTDEAARLQQLADARVRPLAVLLREQSLGLAPPERRTAATDAAVRDLARVGVILRSLEESDGDDHTDRAAAVATALTLVNHLIRSL